MNYFESLITYTEGLIQSLEKDLFAFHEAGVENNYEKGLIEGSLETVIGINNIAINVYEKSKCEKS